MKTNIFKQIIKKEIDSYIIDEDKYNIAILDINPIMIGHTLTIPKNIKSDYIFNLPKKNFNLLMNFSYKIANILKKTIPCKKISLSVIGLEIPYVHVHLIPINSIKDLNFNKHIKISKSTFNNLLNDIKKKIK
ncbi:MAG: HIT family protein [Candidatus Shikimatogenerans bostrichidophilus]|nr:MAG: HIT family protein [Candidatus Shikimatogenerans bostrichidophilus]